MLISMYVCLVHWWSISSNDAEVIVLPGTGEPSAHTRLIG